MAAPVMSVSEERIAEVSVSEERISEASVSDSEERSRFP
jgi:hypothetical protein